MVTLGAYLFLAAPLLVGNEICATSKAYAIVAKSLRTLSDAYTTCKLSHPRLTKVATIATATCGLLLLLDRLINRPVVVPQLPIYFDADKTTVPAGPVQRDVKRETAFLFAHGWGGDCEHVNDHLNSHVVFINGDHKLREPYGVSDKNFKNKGEGQPVGLDCSCCAVNFPDAHRNTDGDLSGSAITFNNCFVFRRQLARSCIGQDGDVQCLWETYQEYLQKGGANKNVVLCGASRGAAAIINFMARSKLNAVKALVLESPFDSVSNVLRDVFLGRLAWIPGLHWFCHQFLAKALCRDYEPRGVQPIDVVDKIQDDIPVLFVCSKTEPYYHATIRLYKKLAKKRREQGKDNVHLLVLEHGNHCLLLFHRDGGLYRGVVHAFYDKYQLERNTLATQELIEEYALKYFEANKVVSDRKAAKVYQNVMRNLTVDESHQWAEYNKAKKERDEIAIAADLAEKRFAEEQKEDQLGREFFATKSRPDPATLPS